MVSHTDTMISVEALRRVFRGPDRQDVVAVDDIVMNVPRGQTLAILGPNGAGKTTLMRMLTTLLPATSGTARVAGMDVTRDARRVRSSIGYVGQGNSAGHTQRARDEVIGQARIHGADRGAAARRATELFAAFGLEGLERRRTQEMSGGQRRRLDLAMGLIHHPLVLFLDEPTTGLDPQNRANLWEHIAKLRTERGATVFLTTHYLDEADALSDRIIIIDNGVIVAADTPENLKSQVSGDLVHLEFADTDPVAHAAQRLEQLGATEIAADGFGVRARLRGSATVIPGLLRDLEAAGERLDSLEIMRPTLDDVFLTLTGHHAEDDTDKEVA